MLLSVNAIEKRFGSELLFDRLSFTLDEGHKIALVGKNGAGKSTILKIVAGEIAPTSGNVALTKGRSIAYLPQEVSDPELTGIDYLQSDSDLRPHQFLPILNGLGVSEQVAGQKLGEMSGGQQSKILLAKFLLADADILLLDEPTNNLDIPSLLWLEEFLKTSRKAMIIISHDLRFLDTVVNRIFELKDGTLTTEKGKYTDYIERKKKEFLRQVKEYRAYQAEVRRLEGRVREVQSKGNVSREEIKGVEERQDRKWDRVSSGMRAASTLKRKLARLEAVEKPFEEEPFRLNLEMRDSEGEIEIELEDLVAGWEHNEVRVGPLSLVLSPGKTVCIMGENGSGKSTMLKTILGMLPAVSGTVKRTEGVTVGDFMQHHERARGDMTAIEFFVRETKTNEERARHMLSRAGFQDEKMNQKVDDLSAGTRARLLFSVFIVLGVNVLVLDEPTNHLDIEAVSALTDMLKKYGGIVLLVSHNRWFLENISVDSFFRIEGESVSRIQDFEKYIEREQKRAQQMVKRLKRMSFAA